MKKKTLLTILAACLLTMGLGSCCFEDWYDAPYGHYGYYHSRPHYDRYHGHHHGHHGPNAEIAPQGE